MKPKKANPSKRRIALPTEEDDDLILGMIVNAIVQSFMRHLPRRRHEEMLVAVEASIHDLREHLPRLRLHRPPKSGAANRRPRKCHYQFGMVLSQLAVRYARLFPRDEGRKAIDAMCAYFYELWEIHRKMKFPRRRR